MNRTTNMVAIGLLSALTACQSGGPMTVSESVSPSFGQPVIPTQTIGFAGPATYLAPLPTAFIILTPDNPARNLAFCQALTATPTTAQVLSKSPVRPNIVETDWLISSQAPADISCKGLATSYDWGRARTFLQALATAAKANGQSLNTNGPGPFVVIVVPGIEEAGGTVVVDASPISDMPTFVQTYQTRIAQITIGLGQISKASQPASAARASVSTPAAAPAVAPGKQPGSASGQPSKPWYSGIFGFVTNILSALWPASTPIVTIIKTVVCS